MLTCIKRTNVHKSINKYDPFTRMCRAGCADGIQIIAVLATFGLFLIENLKIPEIQSCNLAFFNKLNV